MTADINTAVERLTRQMFDADTHYGSDRLGWMVGDVATEDLRLVISELTRLREENATMTRERDEAREALDAETINGVIGYCLEGRDRCGCGGDVPAIRATCINWAALSRQSKDGGVV